MTEFADDHKVNLTASIGQGGSGPVEATETPFSILVLGDFSGRGVGAATDRGLDWRPHRVTPDNVPDLVRFGTRLTLTEANGKSDLTVDSLSALHPDELVKRLPHLAALMEERARVLAGGELSAELRPDPAPESESDTEVGSGSEAGADSADDGAARETETVADAPTDGLLDAILEQGPSTVSIERQADEELAAFVREIVRPHVVSETRVDADDLEIVDRAIASALRTALRDPVLSRHEALWRGLVFLLSRIDVDNKTRVYIVDVSKDELAAEASGSASALMSLLSEPGLGPAVPRWACIVGAYSFADVPADVGLLADLGAIASTIDLPWISQGLPSCVGSGGWEGLVDPESWSDEPSEVWTLLRQTPGAEWLVLALPGFLAREPYGADGARARVPGLEEMPGGAADLPVCNAAFAVAALMARGFAAGGWRGAGRADGSIGQVPVGLDTSSDRDPIGPTRVVLPMSSAVALTRRGVTPLLGLPFEATLRLGGITSLGASGHAPRAWWSSGA